MEKTKKITRIALLVIAMIFISTWVLAIAKCEYLTYKYGDAFEYAYVGHTMFRTPDSFKILEYTNSTAKVYYKSWGYGGDVVFYRRNASDDNWVFDRWETIWSSSGSADSFVWPYFR